MTGTRAIDRELPSNVEAEAALLGALMIDNRMMDRVADLVSAEDFYEPVHGQMFSAISSEIANGRVTTPITITPMIQHLPGIVELGGPAYAAKLTGSGAALLGARDFAKQIADLAKRRRLMAALECVIERVSDMRERSDEEGYQPISEIVEQMDGVLSAALQTHRQNRGIRFAKAFDDTLLKIEDEASGNSTDALAVAGLDDWNTLTGNMRRGEVVILAGRPSMGKTAVGLSVALASARANHGTLFVSLEMSVLELTKRAITDVLFEHGKSASFDAVQRGKFTPRDREAIAVARKQIAQWPLVLHEDAGLKVGRLTMLIRRYQREMVSKGNSLDVVFIDYLGLLRGDNQKHSRHEEIGTISRTLKTIARELNVAIVVLAQLNREVERRDDKRPQLADLRDSGEIEQDADVVIFVYREQYYLERSKPELGDRKRAEWELAMGAVRDRVELISAKVRNGRIDKRNCYFFASHQAVRGSLFFQNDGLR
ncbi:DnaB-like helicase C-terminal domain-containing protein [Sphingomonas qilianensis]|uniref:DNA 5'-3' helicase n=1 Tax=Sphingomonas qilianensis TaxID=1736690 RepID=A0ABU9XQR9_9SPHN